MFRRILIRTLRWGTATVVLLIVGYVLSIGPAWTLLLQAGPDHGWFSRLDGDFVWVSLYVPTLRRLPKPARRVIIWYMGICGAVYNSFPNLLVGDDPENLPSQA